MLSHQDVHYLTGLLQIVTSPRPVEVELGSMILDDAAESERDVDVTVTYRTSDNSTSVVAGLEVKDHSRPLDVTHVEQLGAKLADMSAITSRAIVSSSGYTEPAIRKAAVHGVRLFEFEEWDPEDDVFPARMARLRTFGERVPVWEDLQLTFNPGDAASADLQSALEGNARLVSEDGTPLEKPTDLVALIDLIAREVSASYTRRADVSSLPAGERIGIAVNVEVTDRVFLPLNSGLRALSTARIEGQLYWAEHRHPVLFRRLVDVTDGRRAVAGCGLAEMSTGELIGITTSNVENRGSVIQISAEDRKRAVIRRHRLR